MKNSAAEKTGFPYSRSEEHTSELQSRGHLVCRLLLEKKNVMHGLPAGHEGHRVGGQHIYNKHGLKEMGVTDAVLNGKHRDVFERGEKSADALQHRKAG